MVIAEQRGHTVKVSTTPPLPVRIVFTKVNGTMDIEIVNSSKRFTQEELKDLGEMIQILQAENKLGDNGSILLKVLEKM